MESEIEKLKTLKSKGTCAILLQKIHQDLINGK